MRSFRLLLAIIAYLNLEIIQLDVVIDYRLIAVETFANSQLQFTRSYLILH